MNTLYKNIRQKKYWYTILISVFKNIGALIDKNELYNTNILQHNKFKVIQKDALPDKRFNDYPFLHPMKNNYLCK